MRELPRTSSGLSGVREQVAEATDAPVILGFCDFILGGVGDRPLPDYASINLMLVPRLTPHLFVHDYRAGWGQGMLVKFSGTELDEHYGKVLQGHVVEDYYTGDDADRLFPLHYQALEARRPFLAKRSILFDAGLPTERLKRSTVLFFPCSSDDGATVDFGIGATVYDRAKDGEEPIYRLL